MAWSNCTRRVSVHEFGLGTSQKRIVSNLWLGNDFYGKWLGRRVPIFTNLEHD